MKFNYIDRTPGCYTDEDTTRYVFISQLVMLAASGACALLAAGQTWVYIITVASFLAYVWRAIKSENQLFRRLMVFGIIAGFVELLTDHYSVAIVDALVYPDGPLMMSSPLYMPLSWCIALTQLGYTAALLNEKKGLWVSSLVMGLLTALYIPFYEQIARDAGWWHYEGVPMLWNAPYYVILCEGLIGVLISYTVYYISKGSQVKVYTAGILYGLWILVTAWLAYDIVTLFNEGHALLQPGAYCGMYPQIESLVNLCDYSAASIILIIIGTLIWNTAYLIIIWNAFKNKFIEMPAPAVASNLAWEFVWAFMVVTDLGPLFIWGLMGWFFMDLFIVYAVLKYGAKQISTPFLKQYFKPIWITATLLWIPAFYLFILEGYDTTMGATSAYIITVAMASLFIMFYLSAGSNRKYYAPVVGWLRLIGNCFMTTFVFIHYTEMYFLQFLTVVVFMLNVSYVIIRMVHPPSEEEEDKKIPEAKATKEIEEEVFA